MAKFNYTGRKVQGIKAGQAVSKDLKKRIPPGIGAKAAARDPHVEIDLTGKEVTDEGFAVFVDDLINCIQYRDAEHPDGIVHLTEIAIKGNALTVASMEKLGRVIALSNDSLTQVDISDNQISVTSRKERDVWQRFLESFQGCYLLRKVDFSGNPFGGGGFDVFARVYTQSDLDFVVEPLNNDGVNMSVDTDRVETTSRATGTVGLNQDKENRRPRGDQKPLTRNNSCHQDALKGFGSPASHQEVQATDKTRYSSSRGLRSVPQMHARFTSGLLFLLTANQISCYSFSHLGNQWHPWRRLNTENGIVYTPSKELSALGLRLLDLGIEFRQQNSEADVEVTASQVFDDDDDNKLEESEITKQRELRRKHNIEMERVKNRLLLDVLKTESVYISDIWVVAFKMMRVARAILLDGSTRLKPNEKNLIEENQKNEYLFSPSSEGFLKDFPTIQETLEWNNQESLTSWGSWLSQRGAQIVSGRRRSGAHSESMTGTRKRISKTVKRGDVGRFGLPMDLWRKIIAEAMGASDILTADQQMQVLRYASSWQAIKQELRIRGGTEFEHIWKILSSMGCLTYDHH
ncbi:hypothetical protein GX48_05900 [Paracoccidioides brasiliensis]|nr:hypothetical protein GX48_05900 [Paracoccidioides brasiliensis]